MRPSGEFKQIKRKKKNFIKSLWRDLSLILKKISSHIKCAYFAGNIAQCEVIIMFFSGGKSSDCDTGNLQR